MDHIGWDSRTRTYAYQSQSLVPYRLGYIPTVTYLYIITQLWQFCKYLFASAYFLGAPSRIRTWDTRIRSPMLYPAELKAHIRFSYLYELFMERVKGIEPSQPAWKAGALPLSYTRILVGMSGFEPLKAKLTDLQSVPFGQLWNIPILICGADDRTWTYNLLITNQLLCQLSYISTLDHYCNPNGDLDGNRTHDLRRDRAAF